MQLAEAMKQKEIECNEKDRQMAEMDAKIAGLEEEKQSILGAPNKEFDEVKLNLEEKRNILSKLNFSNN